MYLIVFFFLNKRMNKVKFRKFGSNFGKKNSKREKSLMQKFKEERITKESIEFNKNNMCLLSRNSKFIDYEQLSREDLEEVKKKF